MRWSIPNKMIMEARELVDQGRVLKVIPNEDKHIWRSEVIDDKKYEAVSYTHLTLPTILLV